MAARTRRQRGRFFDRKTELALAGVDVQRATTRPSLRADKEVPFSHFDGTIDDGSRIDFCEGLPGPGVQATENINRCVWRNRSNALGFRNIGNKKCAAARFGQRSRDWFDAATVGVACDYGGAFSRGVSRQFFPIGDNRRQIDLENTAGFRFRRPIARNTSRMCFVVDNEPAPFVYDFSVDRTFNNNFRPGLDCQIAQEVSTNV